MWQAIIDGWGNQYPYQGRREQREEAIDVSTLLLQDIHPSNEDTHTHTYIEREREGERLFFSSPHHGNRRVMTGIEGETEEKEGAKTRSC